MEKFETPPDSPPVIVIDPDDQPMWSSTRNGNVKVIEEDETEPIPTMSNRSLIQSNSPTVSPFLKDSTMHIPYTNANTFANDVLANHVGDKELNSIDGIGIGVLRKKEIKKDKVGLLKEHNKEWEMNEKEEHLGFDDEYDFLTNMIPYKKLSLISDVENISTEASAATSYQIAMIAILNNLTSQVVEHAKTNQEITLENETLKNELVRCKQEIGRLDTQKIKLDLENQVVSMHKMKDKPGHVRPESGFYAKLNAIKFVPQMELSREQAYWLNSQDYTPSKPVTPFVRKGPLPSQVLASLHLVKVVFLQFKIIIIERTTKKPLYVSVACFDYDK
uniref:Uncharacterized protein n=1 Tax=Tanacetum cinerariifolium TaxID=118510 RepID=A0A699I978_TANCI|nr:hypothetical protein [Tanacetum cinerariifolium]